MRVKVLLGALAALFAVALLVSAPAALGAGTAVKLGTAPVPGELGLPDHRAYEEVTPAIKDGGEAGFSHGAELLDQWPLYAVASANGESVLFTQSGAFGNTESGLDLYGVARRTATGGWQTSAALPPVIEEPNGIADLPTYFYPSANLERFAFIGEGKPYVSGAAAESPAGPDRGLSPNLYLTSGGEGSAPSYAVQPQWLSKPQVAGITPALGQMASAEHLTIAGASPTLSRVYFSYLGTLTAEDAARAANLEKKAWGFYEWSEGKLHEAGRLPAGGLDAYGAEPAGLEPGQGNNNPESYNHEVAAEGNVAFFVSPVPKGVTISACKTEEYAGPGGCVPELYARIHEGATTRTVLVSRSELTHEPAATEPLIMQSGQSRKGLVRAYAAPDGSKVFFVDKAALTAAAEAAPSASYKVYEDNLASRGGEGEVVYRPDLNTVEPGGIVGASANGTSLIFYNAATAPYTLDYWHLTPDGKEELAEIAEVHPKFPSELDVENMFVAAAGNAFVFDTPRALTLSGPSSKELNPTGKYREVYRYVPSATGGTLSCLSCGKGTPTGDATLSNDAQQNRKRAVGSRGMNAAGTEVFFDTPEALVPQDVNHTRDVYEWEAPGTGSCPAGNAGGCDYLISSGTSPEESFILDNGESGSNVFFATASALVPGDTEGGYDVYDARVSEGAPVLTAAAPCGSGCEHGVPPASSPSTLTAAAGPSGNLTPPPPPKKHGAARRQGKRGRAKARVRKLRRCRRAARRDRRRHKRSRALRRCAKRFGRAASRGHRRGHRRGGRHHGHGRGHGRAGGKRRRG